MNVLSVLNEPLNLSQSYSLALILHKFKGRLMSDVKIF